MYLLQYFY